MPDPSPEDELLVAQALLQLRAHPPFTWGCRRRRSAEAPIAPPNPPLPETYSPASPLAFFPASDSSADKPPKKSKSLRKNKTESLREKLAKLLNANESLKKGIAEAGTRREDLKKENLRLKAKREKVSRHLGFDGEILRLSLRCGGAESTAARGGHGGAGEAFDWGKTCVVKCEIKLDGDVGPRRLFPYVTSCGGGKAEALKARQRRMLIIRRKRLKF